MTCIQTRFAQTRAVRGVVSPSQLLCELKTPASLREGALGHFPKTVSYTHLTLPTNREV